MGGGGEPLVEIACRLWFEKKLRSLEIPDLNCISEDEGESAVSV